MYTIIDAAPQEASELFYRLNQPTALTSGEQRNALHGLRRNQMKRLVEQMVHQGVCSQNIGLSNSRLAYDDVIARSLFVLDAGTLRRKIGETQISDILRDSGSFGEDIITPLSRAISLISETAKNAPLKLNKASLFSFITFFARARLGNAKTAYSILDDHDSLMTIPSPQEIEDRVAGLIPVSDWGGRI